MLRKLVGGGGNDAEDAGEAMREGLELLVDATFNDDLAEMKALFVRFAKRKPANWRGSDLSTPLHYACRLGRPVFVEFLLAEGALVDEVDALYRTPLALAAGAGHLKCVEVLCRQLGTNMDLWCVARARWAAAAAGLTRPQRHERRDAADAGRAVGKPRHREGAVHERRVAGVGGGGRPAAVALRVSEGPHGRRRGAVRQHGPLLRPRQPPRQDGAHAARVRRPGRRRRLRARAPRDARIGQRGGRARRHAAVARGLLGALGGAWRGAAGPRAGGRC